MKAVFAALLVSMLIAAAFAGYHEPAPHISYAIQKDAKIVHVPKLVHEQKIVSIPRKVFVPQVIPVKRVVPIISHQSYGHHY